MTVFVLFAYLFICVCFLDIILVGEERDNKIVLQPHMGDLYKILKCLRILKFGDVFNVDIKT